MNYNLYLYNLCFPLQFLSQINTEIGTCSQHKITKHVLECDLQKLANKCPRWKKPWIKKRKRLINIKEAFLVLLTDFLRIPLKFLNCPRQLKHIRLIKNTAGACQQRPRCAEKETDDEEETLGKACSRIRSNKWETVNALT